VLGRAAGALRARGARVAGSRILEPDLPPGAPLLRRLLHEAQAAGARLVMADGEAACLPRDARRQVLALPVRLVLASGQTGTAIWPGQ
jgi:hypothetical protein